MDTVLNVKNLTTTLNLGRQKIKPIENISFHVEREEMLGIVGESGCGKSLTVLSIMHLIPPRLGFVSSDYIKIGDRDLSHLSEAELCQVRGRDISMVFQEPMTSLNPALKVGFQIAEPLIVHMGVSKTEALKRAKELLKSVGISDYERVADSYPHLLSGGMRQRAVIAMSMICGPQVLLADEPTTALDVTIQAQILEMLREIQKENHMSIVLVTHDLGIVAEFCDRVMVMYCGQIVEEATCGEIFANALHPYTNGLIRCIPGRDADCEMLAQIPGNVMPITEFERPGCRFASRCDQATDICSRESPPLFAVSEAHSCRCWLHDSVVSSV